MRLKEDTYAWKNLGLDKTDFWDEVVDVEPMGNRPKAAIKKPRKRIDHKHSYVEKPEEWMNWRTGKWETKTRLRCETCGKAKPVPYHGTWNRRRALILAGSEPLAKGL